MSPQESTATVTASAAEAVDFFVGEALARAEVALYRGFLHEVNNATGGVETLAEAIKGSDPQTMDVHLDLISSTMAKTGQLQKRVRSMLSAPTTATEFEVCEFVLGYKDLLELMLPRSVKLQWSTQPCYGEKSPQRILNILMVAFVIARQGSESFKVTMGPQWSFDWGTPSASADQALLERLKQSLAALAIAAGFVPNSTATEMSWSFQ